MANAILSRHVLFPIECIQGKGIFSLSAISRSYTSHWCFPTTFSALTLIQIYTNFPLPSTSPSGGSCSIMFPESQSLPPSPCSRKLVSGRGAGEDLGLFGSSVAVGVFDPVWPYSGLTIPGQLAIPRTSRVTSSRYRLEYTIAYIIFICLQLYEIS